MQTVLPAPKPATIAVAGTDAVFDGVGDLVITYAASEAARKVA